MKVIVRLFARARDLAGSDSVTVELPAASTVGDLRDRLGETHAGLKNLLKHSALAVNNEYAGDSLPLPLDAEVALLPPVSGG
jgi:molybdopterin converting factor small subunit